MIGSRVWKHAGLLFGIGFMCWAGMSAVAQKGPDDLNASRSDYARPATIPFPAENPYSPAKAELGRKLFFETSLSGSGTMSCATCHQPGRSWADNRPRAIGDDHSVMSLRTPTVLDLAWLPRLGWTGHFNDIEAVTFAAITRSGNMNLTEKQALERLGENPAYVRDFAAVFGNRGITSETVEQAIGTYERTIVSGTAPFDRWVAGDDGALSAAAKRGFAVFNSAGCGNCHEGWSFTDGSFHDIGVATGDDIGAGKRFPTSTKLKYAFKTPTLRDVARRAPYMHDGSFPTLNSVIDLYNRGGIDRPSRSESIHPLGLTEAQKADLITFLQSLTSDTPTAETPALPD